jgi:hypothetical protein
MQTERLTIAQEDGERRAAPSLALDPLRGVVGDRRSAKDGLVSLLSGEAEKEIRSLGGLCTARFMANLVTSDLTYQTLSAGAILSIGDCELEIVRVGKPCFEACALARSGGICPLPKSCAFARVLRGGIVRAGDEIRIRDA